MPLERITRCGIRGGVIYRQDVQAEDDKRITTRRCRENHPRSITGDLIIIPNHRQFIPTNRVMDRILIVLRIIYRQIDRDDAILTRSRLQQVVVDTALGQCPTLLLIRDTCINLLRRLFRRRQDGEADRHDRVTTRRRDKMLGIDA